MPLTEQRRQELLAILDRTSPSRTNALPSEYPVEYQNFLTLCDEDIVTRTVDGHPYQLYLYRAKNRHELCPVHINIHGGGFLIGHGPNDSMYSAYLASRIGGIVVDVDYTTSREAQWPVAFDQCYDAALYAFANCEAWNADPGRISAGGYSAGGVLTAGIALKAADTADFSLCLQVLGYPPLDNLIDPIYKKGGLYRILPAEREKAFSELYFGGDTDAMASPYASPLYASDEQLAKLPRALILSAEGCNFRYEDEEYAGRLAAVGVEVTVKRFLGSRHGFIPHFLAGWEEASDLIVRSILSARV